MKIDSKDPLYDRFVDFRKKSCYTKKKKKLTNIKM